MKIEDIINQLNKYIDQYRDKYNIPKQNIGHLNIQKQILPNTFKVFKTYKYILWYIDSNESIEVLTISQVFKETEFNKEEALNEMDKQFTFEIIKLINSGTFNQIINNNFKQSYAFN